MVHLTMTAAIVAVIQRYNSLQLDEEKQQWLDADPDITDPAVGKPVSHEQIINISKYLIEKRNVSQDLDVDSHQYYLDQLLHGSQIYVEPPKPKREQTPEYKALMERLRREEEARQYERMLHSSSGFSRSTSVKQNSGSTLSLGLKDSSEEDEMTFADLNRQVALIINVLVSIIACSIAIWLVANGWSAPTRLALSFGGSLVVATAEVGVYLGYLRRLKIAKSKERKRPEKKEISNTWVIEGRESKSSATARISPENTLFTKTTNVRLRKAQSQKD